MLRDEELRAGTDANYAATPPIDAQRRPLNPLAAGIGLLLVGAMLAILLPFLGIALAACGAIAVLWGLAISWSRK